MPFPVSPDAGVPEHQPEQHPQTGRPGTSGEPRRTPGDPFQPGPFQPGPPTARPGVTSAAPGSGRPRQDLAAAGGSDHSTARRNRIWSAVALLVAAAVIAVVGFSLFGPDSSDEPTAVWAVDACAGPDAAATGAGAATGAFRPLPCTDPGATVTVLSIQDAVSVEQVHCAAGTDIVFQKDGNAGGETQVVCARNLSGDHPGDPGKGGGQLLTGDCVNGAGDEVACATEGARKVAGLLMGESRCPDGTADRIELGFNPERSYETVCLGE